MTVVTMGDMSLDDRNEKSVKKKDLDEDDRMKQEADSKGNRPTTIARIKEKV